MRYTHARLATAALALTLLGACDPDTPIGDPGPEDASSDDAGSDAMSPDAQADVGPDADDKADADDGPDADAGGPSRDPLEGSWEPGFGFAGVEGGPGSGARAVLELPGNMFAYGGSFTGVSGTPARNVALWDGATWSAMGEGVPIAVNTLAYDADADLLYAAGSIFNDFGIETEPNAIWTWDGTAWTKLAEVSGDFTRVQVLRLTDAGELLVGGQFSGVGGIAGANFARLDLASGVWSAPTEAPDGKVNAIERVGDAVCVGGTFWGVGASLTDVGGVACLEGDTWSARAAGVSGEVYDLLADGPAGELIAAGSFVFTLDPNTGEFAAGLARWDGAAWAPYTGGVDGGRINIVRKLEPLPGGAVLALGSFKSVKAADGSATAASHIARLEAGSWSAYGEGVSGYTAVLAPGVEGAYDVAVTATGGVHVAGLFFQVGESISRGVGVYAQRSWRALAPADKASEGIALGDVNTLVPSADGASLYAGGSFQVAGEVTTSGVARMDVATRTWSALGLGLDGWVSELALDPATGDLWAAGDFNMGDGSRAQVAFFDGAQWEEPVGADFDAAVETLVWHEGTLYVGGGFTSVGALPAVHVASWDGTTWSALDAGVGTVDSAGVSVMTVDGSGHLIVGGAFEVLGSGAEAKGLARWDGTAWSAFAEGVEDDLYVEVNDLAFHDGQLYVAGAFTRAGGEVVNSLARWDGTSWSGFGGGFATFDIRDHVYAIAIHEGGVFATGTFRGTDGNTLDHIAWWDGTSWHPLGAGLSDLGSALSVTDQGLWVSGVFTEAGGEGTYGLASWSF